MIALTLQNLSEKIADNQVIAYSIGLILGLVPYSFFLYFNNWNPILLFSTTFLDDLTTISGLSLRFLSGLGIALTYVSFCVFVFVRLSSLLKGNKMRVRIITFLLMIPTLLLILYSLFTIWSAIFLFRYLSDFEFLTMILGVWSLILMVYVFPILKKEYAPELKQTRLASVQNELGKGIFSIWKRYRTHIRRDYGLVRGKEFERHRYKLLEIRAILSGLLLLPISLVLIVITPLALLSVLLWVRFFSLDYKHFSRLESNLLILDTLCISLITTILFTQMGTLAYRVVFDTVYGIGILSGIILLFIIIARA